MCLMATYFHLAPSKSPKITHCGNFYSFYISFVIFSQILSNFHPSCYSPPPLTTATNQGGNSESALVPTHNVILQAHMIAQKNALPLPQTLLERVRTLSPSLLWSKINLFKQICLGLHVTFYIFIISTVVCC